MTEAGRGHMAMLAFSALVAGSFVLGGEIANEIAPGVINAMRFVMASAVIGAAVLLTGGMRRANFRAPWRFVVLGAIFAFYFVSMFEGLKTAAPVSAAAVFTLTPVMAAGFGWLILRQISGPGVLFALLIGAVGALWVIFRGDPSRIFAAGLGRGEAIYFVGCVAHALYAPMVPRLNRGEPALAFTFGMLVAGTGVLVAWSWPDILRTDFASLRPMVWVTLVYLALFASSSTFVLLQYAAMRLPSAKVMAYTYLTPSWVILLQLAWQGSLPGAGAFGGILLTMLALALLLRGAPAMPDPQTVAPQHDTSVKSRGANRIQY